MAVRAERPVTQGQLISFEEVELQQKCNPFVRRKALK
jgi:hypothetical protein